MHPLHSVNCNCF